MSRTEKFWFRREECDGCKELSLWLRFEFHCRISFLRNLELHSICNRIIPLTKGEGSSGYPLLYFASLSLYMMFILLSNAGSAYHINRGELLSCTLCSLGLYFISYCCKAAITQTMGSLWGYNRDATVMSC